MARASKQSRQQPAPNMEVKAYPEYVYDEELGRETDELEGYKVFSTFPLSNHTQVVAVTENHTGEPARPQDKVWYVETDYTIRPNKHHCLMNWMNLNQANYLTQAQALQVGAVISERVGQLGLEKYDYWRNVLDVLAQERLTLIAEGILKEERA